MLRKEAIAPQRIEEPELTEEEIDEIEDELAGREAFRRMNDPNKRSRPTEEVLRELGL